MINVPRHLRGFATQALPQMFADVIGVGVAGSAAPLVSDGASARVLGVKDGRLESDTLLAQAGLAAAVGDDDWIEAHVQDTLGTGNGIGHEGALRAVLGEGPPAVRELDRMHVPFDRAPSGSTRPAAGAVIVGDLMRSFESLVWRQNRLRCIGRDLAAAARELQRWNRIELSRTMSSQRSVESEHLCILAVLLVEAALASCEIRGVHWHTVHPARDDANLRVHVVQQRGEPTRLEPLAERTADQ